MRPFTVAATVFVLAIASLAAVSCSAASAHASTAPVSRYESAGEPATAPEVTTNLDVAQTQAMVAPVPLRLRALAWARTQRYKPYEWGEAGPNGYDCSGLVYAAYQHLGVKRIARDTYGMLAQVGSVLKRVYQPEPGDLAFFGTGHVEFWLGKTTWGHGLDYTYGAAAPGTLINHHRLWPGSWWPTAFYQVV